MSLRLIPWALLLAVSVGEAKENLVNVSWGDRIMVSPGVYRLDTPERIEEALLRWREAYGIDGVLWRIGDERIREEYQNNVTAKFYRDYYDKIDSVRKVFNPIKTACDCARRNGQKFLLYDTFLDQADLPTEAQWEFAFRAETGTLTPWGGDVTQAASDPYAWNSGNWDKDPELTSKMHHVVGQLKPNAYGLYDMGATSGSGVLITSVRKTPIIRFR